MDYKRTAASIIHKIGGVENVSHLEHCSTRLRFTLKVNQIGTIGYDALYLPASLAHNISESGACFGAAIRTKDEKVRATAISAGISALFGITEPALYGLTIQNKRVLWSVLSGCGIGGAFIRLTAIKAFIPVGPGLASMFMFVDASNPKRGNSGFCIF